MKFSVDKKRPAALVNALESLFDCYAAFDALIHDKSVPTASGIARTAALLKERLRAFDVVVNVRKGEPVEIVPPVAALVQLEPAHDGEEGNFLAGDLTGEIEEEQPEQQPEAPEAPKKPRK